MSSELRKFAEAPSSSSSIPPPPEDLRHVDRLAMIGWVATGVVHELDAKLDVASLHAERIANGEVDGEAARASARIVSQQLQRMKERVGRLLAFSQEERRPREVVDLRAIARLTTELFVPLAANRGVTLRMAAGDPLEVEGDAAQLEQVVAALVHNAIQACASGGSVGVTVSAVDTDGIEAACIEVTDDGVGIGAEDRIRIFEPFYSTRGEGGGAGLGLAVADAIVRSHDGWFDLESELGKGSRFRVSFPPRSRTS